MKKGDKVLVKNQSIGDFYAFVWNNNELYEQVDVVLEMPEGDTEVTPITFSYSDIEFKS